MAVLHVLGDGKLVSHPVWSLGLCLKVRPILSLWDVDALKSAWRNSLESPKSYGGVLSGWIQGRLGLFL